MKASGRIKDETIDLINNNKDFSISLPTLEKEIETLDLSIIPVSTQKKPFSPWKQYQKEIAHINHWKSHYLNGGYIGIICGLVSGGLECIDIDLKNDPLGTIYEEYKALIPEELFNKLLIQTTPNSGYHFIYRCPDSMTDGN